MNNFKKLKVGILIDDVDQSSLIYNLYKKSLESKFYEIEYLIIQKKIKRTLFKELIIFIKRKSFIQLIDQIFFELIKKLEKFFLKNNNDVFKNFFSRYSLSHFEVKKIYVKPKISSSGYFYSYEGDELKKIEKLKLDLIIRGGKGILKGKILNLCRLGILSIHHGNNEIYRGGPPGFWEVFNKEPSSGFVIQRINEELYGGSVYVKGSIPTKFLYTQNYCNLNTKSIIFLHNTIEKLSLNNDMKFYPKKPFSHQLYKIPKLHQSILYLIQAFFLCCKKIFGKFLGFSYRWSVAYQFTNDWKSSVLRKSIIIKNPKDRFLADPFIINRNKSTFIFLEEFNYNENKGVISVYEIHSEGYQKIGIAIKEKFHLSYPFLIENENNLFMIPETNSAKDIRIYKCIEFPLKWKLEKVLIAGISSSDTNIIKYNQKFWMFTNIDSSGIGDHSSELHIFYSDDLLSKNWTPHINNPVIFNSLQARNGGKIIFKNNELLRVFQRQGFNTYGRSAGISKIKILTEDQYEEEVIMNIDPNFLENIKGVHTFSNSENLIAFDFSKYEKK